ncbi:MAG: hypothetical protein SynsKO_10670 [Synoicihabitans sp.]
MRITTRLLLACGLLWTALATTAGAAEGEQINVRAILVSASREPGETDRSLSRYESTLRRILRFETFKQLGSGRGKADVPGKGSIAVGQGQSLHFTTDTSRDNRLRVQLDWRGGSRSLMRTGVVLRPGVPAVLGGPSREDGSVYALIVVAE